MVVSNAIDIGADLTDKAFKDLNVGNVLRFRSEKGDMEFKIVKMNRKSRKCFVRQVVTFDPEELDGSVTVVDD